MATQDTKPRKGYNATYSVCRKLPTFSSLSNDDLLEAVKTSIDTYHLDLEQFDKSLPNHLRQGIEATWLELTCVTVHVCNLLNGFCLSTTQATGMMRHMDLLYRVDDFMESLKENYSAHDTSSARELLMRCFLPYLSNGEAEEIAQQNAIRIDSPLEEVPSIARFTELEKDLRAIMKIMHTSPVDDASPQDRKWYSIELCDFFLAQLEQISYRAPDPMTPTALYKWVTGIGARSVGTKYMFAGFSCMISASRNKESCWPTAVEMYMAQQFAQHASVEFRLLNDLGGRVRDERESTMSSCLLMQNCAYNELETIAGYEAACSKSLIQKLSLVTAAQGRQCEANESRRLLDFWRMTVRLSGELYMAGDPTRVPAGNVVVSP